MRRTFRLQLPNGPFGDPLVLVRVRWLARVLLLDCGDLSAVSARVLLDVTDALISHAHVDHVFGLGRLLRTRLGHTDRPLRLFGPPGLARHVRSHLGGYAWNLVDAFPLRLFVFEIGADRLDEWRFPESGGFDPRLERSEPRDRVGAVFEDDLLRIDAAALAHGSIESIGFRLQEHTAFNVDPRRLAELGLEPGRWIDRLKRALRAAAPDATEIEMPAGARSAGELRRALIIEQPGDAVAYASDIAASPSNLEALERLAAGVRLLVLESCFAERDEELARRHAHLTTADAGRVARRIAPAALCPLHFSERYNDEPELVWREVERSAAPVPVVRLPTRQQDEHGDGRASAESGA